MGALTTERGKRVERRLKRVIFGLLAGSSARQPVAPSAIDLSGVRRVLVVRPNFRMGNVLLMTPALAALRRALPEARVDVVGTGTYLELLAHNPDVDGLISIERRSFTPAPLARVARRLRRGDYDLAIDGARGASFLGALLTGLSGSRYRVGSARGRYRRFFNVPVASKPGDLHKVELLLDVLEGIGIPAVTREMKVVLTPDEQAAAAERWRAMGLPDGIPALGINLGGRGQKQWPTDDIVELVRRIQARDGRPIVLFAGPEDEARLAEVTKSIPAGPVVAPIVPIRAFAALLARCAVVVTGDTGPMHLAAAVGVPTVAVFVDVRSRFYRPLGAQHRVVSAVETRADPAAVLRAIDELWPARG
jgi:heptosyltransferase III